MKRFTTILPLLLSIGLIGCSSDSDNTQTSTPGTVNFQPGQVGISITQINEPSLLYPELEEPYGRPLLHNGIFYLTSYDNNAILGFTGIPKTNNPTPAFILKGDQTLRPNSIESNSSQFFIESSYQGGDILVYNTAPTSNATLEPDFVLGGPGCSASALSNTTDISVTEDYLLSADRQNARIMIWNLPITENNQPADLVLGQSDFTHCTENDDDQNDTKDATPSARTLDNPTSVWSDGTRIIAADSDNSRVLIWNTFPTANFAPADLVLGQNNFINDAPNDVNQDGLTDTNPDLSVFKQNYEYIHSNGTQICLGDSGNNRILIWNQFPTQNMQPASMALTESETLFDDASLCSFVGDKLIIGDYGNARWVILGN
ncbi:hypothetical protein [Pelagibaculum spongiae]|uniref:Uncharacterized protein n=1 Tax=Pelagibaculum spongiae TaxID=2080658 RepID=A0A2V1GXL2_9GAMM|nr:hypothetical protein [Pelagibaculum spongiae]PVZ69738.1 hypothetical protein DC094_10585 [Pelagibaculum spongiae]